MITVQKINRVGEANAALRLLGTDPPGISIMGKKMALWIFHIKDLNIRAANILKQDSIAFGGELALPKAASMLKGKKTDGILILNQRQFEQLAGKLKGQPFGLREVAMELEKIVNNYTKNFGPVRVMGILNVTPDSFSDGGKYYIKTHPAVVRAQQLIDDGADIVDIGGESTGPGSPFVSEKEETRRVLPVIEKIAKYAREKGTEISIDT